MNAFEAFVLSPLRNSVDRTRKMIGLPAVECMPEFCDIYEIIAAIQAWAEQAAEHRGTPRLYYEEINLWIVEGAEPLSKKDRAACEAWEAAEVGREYLETITSEMSHSQVVNAAAAAGMHMGTCMAKLTEVDRAAIAKKLRDNKGGEATKKKHAPLRDEIREQYRQLLKVGKSRTEANDEIMKLMEYRAVADQVTRTTVLRLTHDLDKF